MHWRCQLLDTGTRAPSRLPTVYFFSGHFRLHIAQTLALDSMWLPIQNEYSFVTVYCMNLIIFLCVTVKLFSLSFLPVLAPNPGDATDRCGHQVSSSVRSVRHSSCVARDHCGTRAAALFNSLPNNTMQLQCIAAMLAMAMCSSDESLRPWRHAHPRHHVSVT